MLKCSGPTGKLLPAVMPKALGGGSTSVAGGGSRNELPHSPLNIGVAEHDMQLAELVRPIGLVTCPNCRVDMPRVGLKETESDEKLREATYRCPQCQTETRRWIAL